MQRNHLGRGSDTPLYYWLKRAPNSEDHVTESEATSFKVLEVLLEFSGGHDLEVPSGSGDTCLHIAVMLQLPNHMKVMLLRNPGLLYRENAVGRTPAEVAYDQWLALMVSPLQPINAADRTDWTVGYADASVCEDVRTFASMDPKGRPGVMEHVCEYFPNTVYEPQAAESGD